ncbi:MAG: hypothetical protein HY903_13210 [Deltaproteobacteria bacterium]|nr:hypothetical protein [Deltaproteobacteria bacterium]
MQRALGLLATAIAFACAAPAAPVNIPYTQDFESGVVGSEWSSTGGGWRVVDGRLWNDGAHNVPLWLQAALPADVRVTFDAESKSDAVDLKFEIFGDGKNHQSGYIVILAGWNNSKSIIARLDEHGPERTAAEEQTLRAAAAKGAASLATRFIGRREIVARADSRRKDHVYQFRFERRGFELSLAVDGVPVLGYFDPAPLAGPGHDRFAFNNWASVVTFDNLRIEPL